jgi:crossover junction endodeoxyribonuclease RusA
MIFPWPDSRLSPNKRIDRRALIPVKDAAKNEAFYLVRHSGIFVAESDLMLTLTFCPPDRRKRDLDNLYATFKAYQDGMFAALGVDDCNINRVVLRRGAVIPDGRVIVKIKELK